MARRLLILVSFLFLLGGCSQFETGRTFLTEMGHDDSRFFSPNEDFPVVNGDSGEMGLSDDERRERTPASFDDLAEARRHQVLKDELRDLENSQSDRSLELYERHKHLFTTVSEKIFYLKLPPFERRDYLASRGFLIESKRSVASVGYSPRRQPSRSELAMGMSKDDVLGNLGPPARVEVAGNPSYQNERWLYEVNGASKYIYFESGVVGGWE